MKKFILPFTILLSTAVSSGQELLVQFDNSLKESSSGIKDVIPIVNEKNGDISIFLNDANKVYGYRLNEFFQVTGKLTSEDKSRKYKLILGSSISDADDYRIFLSNNKKDRFATITFSYTDSRSDIKEFDLENPQERFIQTINHNNDFYLLSILKNSSIIGFYTFDDAGNTTRHTIDFSNEIFLDHYGKKKNLYDLFMNPKGFNNEVDITKIDEDNPNSIEVTSEFTKFYVKDNKAVFTFDENKQYTQLISFDLNTLQSGIRRFKKPLDYIKDNQKKTNSFLYDQHIFMLSATDHIVVFTVNDFDTGDKLKEYIATDEDTISFKNSPIIQVGGMYNNYREMEKTSKFLRKINAGEVGISIYKFDDNYQITLGGKLEIKASGGGMMLPGMPGIPIGSFGAVTVYFNPAMFAYNSYANTKSTFIECLFDKNFDHIMGEPKDNVFDKIKEFEETDGTVDKATTVFKYKEIFILGNLTSSKNQYILRKFSD